MTEAGSTCIRAIAKTYAEQMAYYRFMNNPNVTCLELTQSLAYECREHSQGRHVLAISDTSEINLQSHAGRLKEQGQGVVGNHQDIGFFIHPTLVVDAQHGLPLGISTVQRWIRPPEQPKRTPQERRQTPIEHKESYKWIESARESQGCFEDAQVEHVTYIGDSESDIYEAWAQILQPGVNLLVRACQDRSIVEDDSSVFAYLSAQPLQGKYELDIPGDPRIPRVARQATLEIRFTCVHLKRPAHLKRDYPSTIKVNVVEALEINPPDGESPVHWRLMTSHPLETLHQARQILQWYAWRWHIEPLFAILKKRILNIESSQLETIGAIQKLCILALGVALQLLQLTLARECQDAPASIVFDSAHEAFLAQVALSVEGRTQKQRNPYSVHSLAWATWSIARLGGWSGYQAQRPPGFVTLGRGLDRFLAMFLGWQLASP
jgi:hypothetical protein